MVEKIRRLKMPQRKNRRNIILGLILMAASVVGVWLAIYTNDKTEEYLVAAKPASSGSMLTSDSLRVARLNLASSSKLYMQPGDIPNGGYLLVAVDAGQLIAKGSVATTIIDEREPVIISSAMPLPKSLKVGDAVDIWVSDAIESGKFAPAVMIVRDAEVTDIVAASGVVADQPPKVQVLVPVAAVATVLDAVASKSVLSLVLKRNLGDD
jgi:hypothetical protein